MKSLIRSIGMAAGIVLLAGVQHAGAQFVDTVEFTTTFPFTAGTATLPAGSYSIKADDDNPNILLLTGAHTGVFIDTTNVPAVRPAKTEAGVEALRRRVRVEERVHGGVRHPRRSCRCRGRTAHGKKIGVSQRAPHRGHDEIAGRDDKADRYEKLTQQRDGASTAGAVLQSQPSGYFTRTESSPSSLCPRGSTDGSEILTCRE